ncbi:FAD-dependent monooxygenase [Pseudonocardia pini]|uniref:FAD-dependent monooxygenase n=1 Tax=Pseudonocardia pini TaxID=2758030 RepID=UPI0015F0C279|nr:FAD-dependent monooxygenase [Pseudonocardia pini]
MRIVCVGGGPAALYFAVSAKRRDAAHEITVVEKDPRGATYGWGVVCQDGLLDMLYRNDRDSAQAIRRRSRLWQEQEVHLHGEGTGYLPGYGFSVPRAGLLDVLATRALDLGVEVSYEHPVPDSALTDGTFADADLVVVADGARSRLRDHDPSRFGTTTTLGRNPYIWLGTEKVFSAFTFAFERTHAGWVWCYAYPTSAGVSTLIVECLPETFTGLGLDTLSHTDGIALLEKVFADVLDGQPLISSSRGHEAPWLRFLEVRNETWQDGNVVLLGDAAHTTHFTMGQGTRLAMADAVMLAQSLAEHPSAASALGRFDRRGREALGSAQASARTGAAWFERVDRYLDRDAVEFAYALAHRQGTQPEWRFQQHRATQYAAYRRGRRVAQTGRRWWRARRRGESL